MLAGTTGEHTSGISRFNPKELMKITFEEIGSSDIVIVEFSEKGVGLGIEAGYAWAKEIPVWVIAQEGVEISTTLQGISTRIIFYEEMNDLKRKLRGIK